MLPHCTFFLPSELPDDELDSDEILGAFPLLLVFVVVPARLLNPRKLAMVSRRLRKEEVGRTGEVGSGTSSVVRREESWRSSAVLLSHSWGVVCSFVLLGESLKLRIDEAVLERLCVGGEECFCRRRLSRRESSGRATGETSVGGPFSNSGADAELLLPLKVDQRCLAADERGRAPLGRWGLLERRSERYVSGGFKLGW